jgi:metal-sulfur cluster biosynthetic enzyme
LVDLGIVKKVYVKDSKVMLIMAFPFPNIPIADHLVNSVREPIEELGAEVEVKITVMNQEELERFLAMEQESWKGGM